MKRFLGLFVIALCVFSTYAQRQTGFDLSNYGVRIDPDKRLMVVLAALEVAGTKDADGKLQKSLNIPLTAEGEAFRARLLEDNAAMPDELRARITAFVTQYKRAHPGVRDAEVITPFISMSYALSPAPALADPMVTGDLPGSLLDVLDFAPLVREFYKRSTIAGKLDEYIKDYRAASAKRLAPSTREMVGSMLDYLHTRPQLIFTEKVKVVTPKVGSKTGVESIERREHDRHFYVVPELLVPHGVLNFVNVRDDYYLVVSPDTDLTSSEGRRAFLRFIVDPLVLNNAKDLAPVSTWAKPVLETLRKSDANVSIDPFLAVSRSLVAAIDIRETEYLRIRIADEEARKKIAAMGGSDPKREVSAQLNAQKQAFADEAALQLYEEYQRGAVLSFYFAEQLKGVEDSGFDIASSLKDMIIAFDPAKESGRVAATEEARKRAAAARAARKTAPAETVIAANPVSTRLLEIEKVIEARDLAKAQADLKQLLAQYPAESRVYYALGRVASLQASKIDDPEAQAPKLVEAKVAYTNVLNTANASTDPTLLSLTYVALGGIYEFFNDDATASALYDKAIKIGDVKDGGYSKALAAKQRLLKP